MSLILALFTFSLLHFFPSSSAATISPTVPTTPPSSAIQASPKLISFSLEGDNWPSWAAQPPQFTARNDFFFNTLQNLQTRTGSWPDIRVGANSEDRTGFNTNVNIITETFPAPTTSLPYQEGQNITVGPNFYTLSRFLPSGTDMTWGFNFGSNNLTLATTELNAILNAFSTSTSQGGVSGSGVNLKFVELGNEPDLYGNNGHRASGYSISDYVTNWTQFITSLLNSTALGSSSAKIQALSLGNSDFGKGGFSPQQAIKDGIFSNSNIKSHVGVISQHKYSGGCCTAKIQDLMNKALIRSNLTEFENDISAVKATGIPYVFGETNTYFNHGVPKISDAAGAAIWLADYTLFGASIGIGQMFFHEGVGYKYNLIQPVTLNRSVDDATTLSPPAQPHVQSSYYGALVVNEFLGTSSDRSVIELDFTSSSTVSGFALYTSNALKRILLVNHDPFISSQGNSTRPSVSISLSSLGNKNISLKKLSVPFADVQTGLTWAGQSFDSGVATGNLQVTNQTTQQSITLQSSQIILVQF